MLVGGPASLRAEADIRSPQGRGPSKADLRNFLLARRAYRLDLNAMPRIVVIVGRPNVGKSRLFNRLARKRISVVHDQPGVTRDVVTAEVKDGEFTLLDTGGLGLTGSQSDTPALITKASEQQVHFAVATANVILFVIDAREGVTALDERIAGQLRRSKKTVLLIANKADSGKEKIDDISDFHRLGFGEPFYISAEHGNGEAELRTRVLAELGPIPELSAAEKERLDICFV